MYRLFARNVRLAYRANPFYIRALTVTQLIYAALDLSTYFFLARLIDLFIKYLKTPAPALMRQAWIIFALLALRWILANFCNQFLDYLGDVHKPKVVDYVDNAITAKLDHLDVATIESTQFQDRITNIHTFAKAKFVDNLDLGADLLRTGARFVYAFIVLLISNPLIALLILIVSIPEVRYNLAIVRKMRELNERLTLERRKRAYFINLTQDITQFANLKSFNLFPYFLAKIKRAQATIIGGAQSIQRYHKPRSATIGTAANLLGQFIPKGYYVWAAFRGKITIGQFQLYYNYIDALYNSTYQFYDDFLKISENNIYVSDLLELLDMPEPAVRPNQAVKLDAVTIEFKNVSFTYPESDQPVLHNLSFSVPVGGKLAIVGANGAGKTTIIRLLSKFYAPTTGQILINGVDLRVIDDVAWREHLSNLSQDIPRYALTVKENVTIGDQKQQFDPERFQASLKQAELTADVAALPEAEHTMLGKYFPGGINLSGGQWQKLAVARNFYRRAPLLVLDEPTSAIDSQTEHAIFGHIFSRHNHQTQIIVSHKFANIKQADHIIVLGHGRIIEQGSHTQLMAKSSDYARLYRLQSDAFQEAG